VGATRSRAERVRLPPSECSKARSARSGIAARQIPKRRWTYTEESTVSDQDYEPTDARSDVRCRGCNAFTVIVGTFSACQNAYCERYAMPVNDKGQTDDEALAEAVKPLVPDEGAESAEEMDADATGFREYLNAGPSHNEFGYARND
jgi:hypothetical protein